MPTSLLSGRGLRRRALLPLVVALPLLLSEAPTGRVCAAAAQVPPPPSERPAATVTVKRVAPEQAKPKAQRRAARRRAAPVKTWRLYALDDANAAKGEINALTEDNEFVTVRVGPDTTVHRAGAPAAVGNIKHGYVLRCSGGFTKFGEFAAREISLGATVDDVVLTRKLSLACSKVSGGRGISRAAPATPEPPAPAVAEKPADEPAEAAAEKDAPKAAETKPSEGSGTPPSAPAPEAPAPAAPISAP